jgi:hypothetical protein
MEISLANEIIEYVRCSNECHSLYYKKLGALLELVIHNTKVVDILKTIRISDYDNNKVNCFTTAYDDYINNNKQFILLRDIDSLALSWLHCIYH